LLEIIDLGAERPFQLSSRESRQSGQVPDVNEAEPIGLVRAGQSMRADYLSNRVEALGREVDKILERERLFGSANNA